MPFVKVQEVLKFLLDLDCGTALRYEASPPVTEIAEGGACFIVRAEDTAALFDLPTSDTFQQQEQIPFRSSAITLLLETDGSYGEFNGRASGRYRFVRAPAPIPEPSAALLFAVGFGSGSASRFRRAGIPRGSRAGRRFTRLHGVARLREAGTGARDLVTNLVTKSPLGAHP